MKLAAAVVALMGLAGAAEARIPLVNAICPGDIEVHADEGGPIYVNGEEAELTVSNDNYYEAAHGGVVISLMINPDGSPDVSYTGSGGANGVCAISE